MKNLLFILFIVIGINTTIAQNTQLGEPPQWPYAPPKDNPVSSNQLTGISNGTCDRATIISDYNTNFLGSSVSTAELAWTGSVAGCVAGNISTLAQNRVIQRINYYRKLVGLPSNMTFDASRNTNTQEASLMMKANNTLNHCVGSPDPCAGFTCYTAAGSTGAQNSNLSLGSHSSNSIKGYMDDPGAGNTAAGHRRWILYSRAQSFGHGSTDNSDALWVFNTFGNPSGLPPYVAWPAAGYVPRNLISYRWSFSIPSADFSSCTVVVQDENNVNLSITKNSIANGYGDNTVVWDLNNAADYTFSGTLDRFYKVTISGVKIGGVTQPNYVYNVIAIEPSTPSLTINAINPTCGTNLNNGSATANFDRGAKSYLWSNGATTQTITGLAPGTYTVTVTDKNDCTYSTSVILNNTTVSIPTLTQTACLGSSITLQAGNCNGTINWSHGLGTGLTKTVTPTTTTDYQVTCTEGTCTSTPTTLTVNPIPQAAICTPTASNGLSIYFGVENFTFNTINKTSSSANADGANYIDRTCTEQTTVVAGNTYSMSVKGYYTNNHIIKVYIDYNGNGDFTDDAGSPVLSGTGNIVSGSITIPLTAKIDSALRVRVLADISSSSNSCSIVGSSIYGSGQIEDYTVIITRPCNTNLALQSTIHDFSTGTRTIKANSTNGAITASNKLTGYSRTTYEARSVTLTNGFLAAAGTVFTAKVGGCP